jgi:hypothetical protein
VNDVSLLSIVEAGKKMRRGRASLYADMKTGLMVRPVRVGHLSAIPVGEIEKINLARIRGATDDELRTLVQQLHEARKVAA